ncbi:MAG: hypothetical protein SFY66_06835 [Oculatellaceae cyanobacterium bins.114]|nr:hypothetical protein [Oculatellaceae cyanobacterium bins.114]
MCIYRELNDEQKKTLKSLFADPPSLAIAWSEITSLLRVLSHVVKEYEDRVCVAIEHKQLQRRAIFHRRRGQTYATSLAIKSIRYFLITVNIEPMD